MQDTGPVDIIRVGEQVETGGTAVSVVLVLYLLDTACRREVHCSWFDQFFNKDTVSGFYPVFSACSVLLLSFEPMQAVLTVSGAVTCRHSVLWLVYLLIFFNLCVSE